MNKKINESILSKITNWAQNMSKTGTGDTKKAGALAAFLSNEQMQAKMQEVAIDQLVHSFADALKTVTDAKAKQTAINQFWATWKDKTNQAVLTATMSKYKLVPTKR